ncbi:MAG: hypothetical protein QE284_20315, partial [Rhizobium sp.]|nr:hypothetical protein [Rhizobium sp.]
LDTSTYQQSSNNFKVSLHIATQLFEIPNEQHYAVKFNTQQVDAVSYDQQLRGGYQLHGAQARKDRLRSFFAGERRCGGRDGQKVATDVVFPVRAPVS